MLIQTPHVYTHVPMQNSQRESRISVKYKARLISNGSYSNVYQYAVSVEKMKDINVTFTYLRGLQITSKGKLQ